MIEQHYVHLHPAQKADVIAGTKLGSRKQAVKATTKETKPKLKVVK